ncbi:hypothetical protein ACFFMM_09520 [Micromonospora chaiyaphumensis]|uniref:Zinc-finger n=1 Tax=Micromonospora chaiyaphumensis TaxID=307119 RepID=A0A1C4XTC5_9ACTN|nr:hypothetical protein [Micromonospora chaiyaphumensis]SCF11361.1 hypothetical protein GA0070214_106318 [Micromonospora chaiyaphumensis]
MTSRKFSEVDHDLLADYLGGALDGTPEQATVARLVEQDPAWAEAHAALARAVDLVEADLAQWAAAPAPELPPAVADRITAALAGAGPAPAGDLAFDPAEPGSTPAAVPAQPNRGAHPASAAGRKDRNTGPGRRSRRWARLAGPVALAAASVTAVGFGVSHLVDTGAGQTTGAVDNAGSRADGGAAPMAAAPFQTTGPARHSGTDYTPDAFSGLRTEIAGPSATASDKASSAEGQDVHRLSEAVGLERLARPEALASCLSEIGAEHRAGPLTVDLIDYARFQGRPALVVTFTDAGGARWAWVSGPECGVPGSGADTRFTTRVG